MMKIPTFVGGFGGPPREQWWSFYQSWNQAREGSGVRRRKKRHFVDDLSSWWDNHGKEIFLSCQSIDRLWWRWWWGNVFYNNIKINISNFISQSHIRQQDYTREAPFWHLLFPWALPRKGGGCIRIGLPGWFGALFHACGARLTEGGGSLRLFGQCPFRTNTVQKGASLSTVSFRQRYRVIIKDCNFVIFFWRTQKFQEVQ